MQQQMSTDPQVAAGAVLLIGDSIIRGIPDDLPICSVCINYGIIGDTTKGILVRLPRYTSLKRARAVVLEGGINNFFYGGYPDTEIAEDYEKIFAEIPNGTSILLIGVMPVDENTPRAAMGWTGRIASINGKLLRLCERRSGCKVSDVSANLTSKSGGTSGQFHTPGDGIHFSAAAYVDVIAPTLRRELKALGAH